MRKLFLTFLLCLGTAAPAAAQLGSVPYTFTPGTTILSAEVNANFSGAYSNALNRTGGTMTGTLNTLTVLPVTNGLYDLGSTSFRYQGLYTGVVNASGLMTAAGGIKVTGGASPGAGSLYLDATNGLVMQMVTGSGKDFRLNLNSGTEWASIATGTTVLTITGDITLAKLVGTDTTDSSSSTTGAVKTAGGLGVAKALFVGTTLNSAGLTTLSAGAAVRGTTAPTTGQGLEIVGGSAPTFQAYNRDGSAYLALITDALSHNWKVGGTGRWGIGTAGDFTFGPSAHIVFSDGVPSYTAFISGTTGSMAGSQTDYAFTFTAGTGNTSQTITFGHTFSNAAVCTANAVNGVAVAYTTTTTTIVFTITPNATVIHVHCQAF